MYPPLDKMGRSGIQSGAYNLTTTNLQRVKTANTMQMPGPHQQPYGNWIQFTNYDFYDRKKIKMKKSGITVIDKYYEQIQANEAEEVECVRQSTEFRRILSMIQSHWKAKRFPRCEQLYVNNAIAALVEAANTQKKQEMLIG